MTMPPPSAAVPHEELWRHIRTLLDRVSRVLGNEAIVDDCVDVVVDFLGADRGLVVMQHADGSTQPFVGRAAGRSLQAVEREEISKTIIQQAFESGEAVVWDPMLAPLTTASAMTLGISGALAAPLHTSANAHGGRRGVLYVDFRDSRKRIDDRKIEFFLASAVLLGVVFEQRRLTETAVQHMREVNAQCVDAGEIPSLESLLAPEGMRRIRDDVKAAVASSASILIQGESGTGKTLIARAIAEASGRRPIVRAMLGTSDDLNTIVSELFGHERGAFSGAARKRIGLVELANGGTLMLDELLNLAPNAQKLLLDFTQFGTYRPLGYERPEPRKADVRIIASTNGDLDLAMREGRFRRDLYHRLAGIELHVPSLRERREDVPQLVEAALRAMDPGRRWTLTVPLRRLLLSEALDWPGNVRELEHAVRRARERAVAGDAQATALDVPHLRVAVRTGETTPAVAVLPAASLESEWRRLQEGRVALDDQEEALIRTALEHCEGVVARAARELGVARTTLASRIEALSSGHRGS